MAKVLITGGTGLVGTRLTQMLIDKNYSVVYLSRDPSQTNVIKSYKWDVRKQEIDQQCLEGVNVIIHLAGAGVADKKWTRHRKEVIRASRIKSTELLFNTLKTHNSQVKTFISSSAIGYYGYDSGGVWKKEESRFGDDFLATVTKDWEAAADRMTEFGIRVVKLRTGMVLSKYGGALEKMAQPIKYGFGAPLGSGDQYMSWIHIDDLCRMYIEAIENDKYNGAYNAVAPTPETNKQFTKTLAAVLKKPCFLPNVPGFMLKLVLGEMASIVLGGTRVSSGKIQSEGFAFKFEALKPALENLLRK